ncbi:Na/Pi cotransporter family protein [Desulfuribacillus alkaliarsenatis]|uniref:Na/Pi cotransporter n=1 Tax=Desulfuribacillus alkaliarsenatis TaxID=766136 RepID=A0A1E5G0Z2_9FIRM|nr:Na/Pi symporter [Desulfuribacillus alkaliarsenatis]OEF96582.1 hypothetical protein BHF68_08015 [Desulfuribacillus alkaliarsenatis]
MTTFALILGGVGLFLLGMNLMTEGLKALAGESLKNMLSKFTGGTYRSIMTGATMTAIIQSSSATTFMTIGFVSAGLLTFSQSVGVIIGANLGGTSTGWIVSVIGFKINMSAIALPVIGVGILMKLLSSNRLGPHGYALAGFGLIFLGIAVLQDGMADFTTYIDLTRFAGDQWWVIPILLIIGIVMTVVMQSSSAAVVTTLAALHTGVIDFNQAAVLVIGQNVGTTIKAIIATIGGTIAAKQTAMAHITFNLLTGLLAVVFLPWLIQFVFFISSIFQIADLAVILALFHTVFNVIGVLIIVAILPWFAKVVKWVYPDEKDTDNYSRYLDDSVAEVGPVAIEAARRALLRLWGDIVDLSLSTVAKDSSKALTMDSRHKKLDKLNQALAEIRMFLLKTSENMQRHSKQEYKAHVALVHAVDHIDRLIYLLKEDYNPQKITEIQLIDNIVDKLRTTYESIKLDSENLVIEDECLKQLEIESKSIAELRKQGRKEIYKSTAKGAEFPIDSAIVIVQTIHWLDRLAYHLWRSANHLTIIGLNESDKLDSHESDKSDSKESSEDIDE